MLTLLAVGPVERRCPSGVDYPQHHTLHGMHTLRAQGRATHRTRRNPGEGPRIEWTGLSPDRLWLRQRLGLGTPLGGSCVGEVHVATAPVPSARRVRRRALPKRPR